MDTNLEAMGRISSEAVRTLQYDNVLKRTFDYFFMAHADICREQGALVGSPPMSSRGLEQNIGHQEFDADEEYKKKRSVVVSDKVCMEAARDIQEDAKCPISKERPADSNPDEEDEEPMADFDVDEPDEPKDLQPISTPIGTPRPAMLKGARGTLALPRRL